ncbi:MAG: biotin--[acetyl-CoA-carboxylase] ligase [Coriobacteriia bacterium]
MSMLSSRAAVASALAAAGPAGISGEAIASAIGISRVAVSKHVASLRVLGYEVRSAPRAGYVLVHAPDACIPEEVAPRLRDPLWVACEGAPEIGSTNDEAKRLARAGAAEGTAVVAACQTGGRGRLGRVWESPAGGAYVSCVLRPSLAPAQMAPLSLALALGAARALEPLGVDVALKWPNDLEYDGRKLGGLLLEMAAEADRTEWVIAGCGVNVSEPGLPGSAWVREAAPDALAAAVAAALLDGMAGAYRSFVRDGFGVLREEFEARASLTGREVTVRDAAGVVVDEGVVRGVAEDGSLLLQRDGDTVRVSAGAVTLRG